MRELAAEGRFRLAFDDPDAATASSRSARRFEWNAIYRRGTGVLEVEAIGEGRAGVTFRLADGSDLSVDFRWLLNRGPQTFMCVPATITARGGRLGFLTFDDWWSPDGDRV